MFDLNTLDDLTCRLCSGEADEYDWVDSVFSLSCVCVFVCFLFLLIEQRPLAVNTKDECTERESLH